jgi:superfamily II DNA or RNA helicase
MFDYLLKLCKVHTDLGKNVLVIMTNQQPSINMFEYALSKGLKAHLIFGGTDKRIRNEIKQQIEHDGGWILVGSSGTMSMGISINNLHACILTLLGKSAHVVLQGLGRMLRNNVDKFESTPIYDVSNDITMFGTKFDLRNGQERLKLYQNEQHNILEHVKRFI